MNGAGKSSVGGASIRARGADYFNPDEAARRIADANPGLSSPEANAAAWNEGKRLLERAIAERLDFAFETTLGGRTITDLLLQAIEEGLDVRIWYVGLDNVEQHIARVRARVAAGGHDIPEAKVRERFTSSRLNLIRLLKVVTEVRVYDNSVESDPAKGQRPQPRLLLHMLKGRIEEACNLAQVPGWAKPIFARAMGRQE